MDPAYPLLVAMIVSLVLFQINQRKGSPVLAIINRWLRWLVFAFGAAYVCRDFQLIERPFWALVALFFLIWFLVETLYNWMAISALSLSPLPLFPRYTVNQNGDEWPTHPSLLKVRTWLRNQNFKQVQALRAEIGGDIFLRVSVYQDVEAKLRIQIMFLPQPGGVLATCYVVTSLTADGRRFVTDNLHIPFGGFYPEDWHLQRSPWRRSLPKLVAQHRARMQQQGGEPVPIPSEPLLDINTTQAELDRLNTELGFLVPHAEREEQGKITHEGRYRVWKEIWMLDYLGRSARYH
ncbi:MAG: hypothetical protein HZA31_02525 [Opitutae bacterium]|nr:hypothetical protein [Opitutae bacterium]